MKIVRSEYNRLLEHGCDIQVPHKAAAAAVVTTDVTAGLEAPTAPQKAAAAAAVTTEVTSGVEAPTAGCDIQVPQKATAAVTAGVTMGVEAPTSGPN